MKKLESTLRQHNTGLCKIAKSRKPARLVIAIIGVLFLCGILSGLIIANVKSLYQTSSTISSVGTFKAVGIGVYWNAEATRNVEALDWGFLAPGSQKSFVVYVSNEGVLPLTCSVTASNWDPPVASNYLTLTCSHNDQIVDAHKTVPVTITLTLSSSVTGVNSFNFDITATGTYNN
jgi:hypothetical protein